MQDKLGIFEDFEETTGVHFDNHNFLSENTNEYGKPNGWRIIPKYFYKSLWGCNLGRALRTNEKINLLKGILDGKSAESLSLDFYINLKAVKLLANILTQYREENISTNFEAENIPDIYVAIKDKNQNFYERLMAEMNAESLSYEELENIDDSGTDEFFKFLRFENGVYCVHCGYMKIYETRYCKKFKCSKCRKEFTVRTNTIFKGHRIPISYYLLYLMKMIYKRSALRI